MIRWFRIVRRKVRRKTSAQSKKSKVALALHKDAAKALVLSRLEYFSQFYSDERETAQETSNTKFLMTSERSRNKRFNTSYNFTYNSVKIKSTKTRWGSCSSKGNLNFSYKIALLPEHLADYLVVHELCHLGEFNHSENFWNLVEKTIPDFAQRRHELKKIKLD
ncbi:MAG: M48 family metallopeptidase [Candidatus Paceibacterota bacterium]